MSSITSSISLIKSEFNRGQTSKITTKPCQSKSNCCLQKRKQIHPLAVPLRNLSRRSEDNLVQQRLLSAKINKMKNLENQLNDAKFHLKELTKENRALKTLQLRQEKVLDNCESINSELPRLLNSHEEDNRVLLNKTKTLKIEISSLREQLKNKDYQICMLTDRLKQICKVSNIKELEDRATLQDSLRDANITIKKYENEINLLNRKVILEVKNCNFKLNAEIIKNKGLEKELARALNPQERNLEEYEKNIKSKLRKKDGDGKKDEEKNKRNNLKKQNINDIQGNTSEESIKNEIKRASKGRGKVFTEINNSDQEGYSVINLKDEEKPSNENRLFTVKKEESVLDDKAKTQEQYIATENKDEMENEQGIANRKYSNNFEQVNDDTDEFEEQEENLKSNENNDIKFIQQDCTKAHKRVRSLSETKSLFEKEENRKLLDEICNEKKTSRRVQFINNPDCTKSIKSDAEIKDLCYKNEKYDLVHEICKEKDPSRRSQLIDKAYKKIDRSKDEEGTSTTYRTKGVSRNNISSGSEDNKDVSLKEEDFDFVNNIWSEEYEFRKSVLMNKASNKRIDPKIALLDKKKLLEDLDKIDKDE